MGLDQFWFSQKTDSTDKPDCFVTHRKAPALQKYMAERWAAQTGENPEAFNCVDLPVDSTLLDDLQKHVNQKTLDHDASGFFWGKHYDEDYADFQTAIDEARRRLEKGEKVYYSSWW